MSQNRFQVNGSFYEPKEGTAIKYHLSAFIAKLFMSNFETDLKIENDFFPKVSSTNVDDILVVFDINKSLVQDFVGKLKLKFDSIKFTT